MAGCTEGATMMTSAPGDAFPQDEGLTTGAPEGALSMFGRRGGTISKRQVWLEREMARLNKEVSSLLEENEQLAHELQTNGMPSGVLRPELIELEETEGDEAQGPIGVRLAASAESFEKLEDETDNPKTDSAALLGNAAQGKGFAMVSGKVNTLVMKGSALSFGRGVQMLIYLVALAGVIFVLVGTSMHLGAPADEFLPDPHGVTDAGGWHADHTSVAVDDEAARRLGGAAPASGQNEVYDTAELMKSIAVSLTGCGLIALTVNLLQQPLILGYLLGGVLVGPIGLDIVHDHTAIGELSSLGLIFLLFMIGLELDVKALLKMGRVVLITGALQFPICAGAMVAVFMGLERVGLNFGAGPYAAMYCGMVGGISSTMVVVKLLSDKGEMDSQAGRLTIGILIFQDIWAIIILAIQPNMANPEIVGILKTFGMIAVLIVIALAYAKFVMPAVLYHTSKNLELMLVMSLSWCFFICVTAILPFVGLSMELASLIAGVALATFPYSAEFNGKIKYIRDFFITLFFAGLGMQIPVPTIEALAMGVLVSIVLLIFRWPGIHLLVVGLGGGTRLGVISTINLSQISEFALVICSLGINYGHVQSDTMVIIIWCFAILAIGASYMIGYNQQIYQKSSDFLLKLRGKKVEHGDGHHGDHHGDERDIVLLGYHKVAFMLIAEIKAKSPQLLKRIAIIDFNQAIMPKLRALGLQCSYGDISSPDVLEHAHHGEPRIVISTIPDSVLRGTTNAGLVKAVKQVWPQAHVIVTADSPEQARQLYSCGADYVLRMAKLCAERLHELLSENRNQALGGGELQEIFNRFQDKDRELRSQSEFIAKGTFNN